jgi:HSP20 family protein
MQASNTETQTPAPASVQRQAEAPLYTPPADIFECGDGYRVYLDVPGARLGDVDVTYAKETLTVHARVKPRRASGQEYLAREYGVGDFQRSFNVTAPIDGAGIRAELKNGELSLFVPKAESAKTRKIAIKAQ